METFEPTYNRVLIKPIESETTKSGIFVPASSGGGDGLSKFYGEVVAVGPGSWTPDGERRPLSVKIGDRVHWAPATGVHMQLNGQLHVVVNDEAVLGVLKGR